MATPTGPGRSERRVLPPCLLIYNFDIDGDRLKPEHERFLQAELVPSLQRGGSTTVVGLADRSGAAGHNERLSLGRAQNTVAFLRRVVPTGFAAEPTVGLGESTAELVGQKDGRFDERFRSVAVFHWANPTPPTPPSSIDVSKPPVQVNYWRSRIVIPFMHQEMITNAQSREAVEIRDMITGKRARQAFPVWGEPGERAARGGMILSDSYLATTRWRDLVKTNARWDHKPQLRDKLRLKKDAMHFPIEGDKDHEWFYDIWSNIHYGYVGRAAGFSGGLLQWGAARGGAAGRNDPIDVETVQIGIDLWDQHGLKLTQQQFHDEILRRKPKLLQLQETEAYKTAKSAGGGDPGFRHLRPITTGE